MLYKVLQSPVSLKSSEFKFPVQKQAWVKQYLHIGFCFHLRWSVYRVLFTKLKKVRLCKV